MTSLRPILPLAACIFSLVHCLLPEGTSRVLINDRGLRESVRGPGAPKHIVGLTGIDHQIDMNTGTTVYALKYTVSRDAKDETRAIPGEGYIGMPGPNGCNWYASGFFDLQINGRTIGTTMARPLFARSVSNRAYIDFIFDAPQALVRVRFVAEAGENLLYAQALLEPKEEITALRLTARCYPSAFIKDGERHMITAARDAKQGDKVDLDTVNESWALYLDTVYDQGYRSSTHTGAGPCAMLWPTGEVVRAGCTVGSYGTDTAFELSPSMRDLRFVFIDFSGTKNRDATATMRSSAADIAAKLASFDFRDPAINGWDLEAKRDEVKALLATAADETSVTAQYKAWSRALDGQLAALRSTGPSAIAAEQEAVRTIDAWDNGLAALRLKALLNGI